MSETARPRRSLGRISLGLVVVLVGCHPPGAGDPSSGDLEVAPAPVAVEPTPIEGGADPAPAEAVDAAEALEPVAVVEAAEPEAPAQPLETRMLTRIHTVYSGADSASARRGRIPHGNIVHVYATTPGPHCKRDWAQIGLQVHDAGWVCLDHSKLSEGQPTQLPVLLEGSDLPFVYARHRHHRDPATAELAVYRNLRQLKAGEAPESHLPAHGSYAFQRRVWTRGGPVLIRDNGRVVSAADMRRFRPSEFEGRDLVARPIAPQRQLGWGLFEVTELREGPGPKFKVARTLARHAELELLDKVGVEADGTTWFEVAGEAGEGTGNWVRDDAVARFVPSPLPGEGAELLLDVDLEQQTLAIYRGGKLVFATLVSSGKLGDRTPLGIYRLQSKWAYSKMANRPGAADTYYVDAVPWAMYFSGRYAFHGVYWHNRFGQRMSHGCVNLSPRDAKRVFEISTPVLPPAWILAHEHPGQLGSTVRIRRGARPVPDRREASLQAREEGEATPVP